MLSDTKAWFVRNVRKQSLQREKGMSGKSVVRKNVVGYVDRAVGRYAMDTYCWNLDKIIKGRSRSGGFLFGIWKANNTGCEGEKCHSGSCIYTTMPFNWFLLRLAHRFCPAAYDIVPLFFPYPPPLVKPSPLGEE